MDLSVYPWSNSTIAAALKAIRTQILNELAMLTVPLLLVLDDYHLLTTPAIHEALAFLVDHPLPLLHLIITTRIDPPLPLARWCVRNQLVELRADELRFTRGSRHLFQSSDEPTLDDD